MSEQLPTVLELAFSEIAVMHRGPRGIWCVPSKGFTIHEPEREYECVECGRRWRFRMPEASQ
jgi:hypothetical protein